MLLMFVPNEMHAWINFNPVYILYLLHIIFIIYYILYTIRRICWLIGHQILLLSFFKNVYFSIFVVLFMLKGYAIISTKRKRKLYSNIVLLTNEWQHVQLWNPHSFNQIFCYLQMKKLKLPWQCCRTFCKPDLKLAAPGTSWSSFR